ncbi:LacI family DNA-binding transcriptional regulator [Pseudoscardovia suis]|uniref:LacI family transcriptional regulator n=1 Tax=Pseudoscardovia suis TaxID=987063 RepID=A0A261ES86_9BIFI|nr:LacI family DNA-binding transcriptional regulator [Pseudoscardovia suis]OZG49711.1 LacI family transcriptional regulator [Pseudoscardovia suis]PJJ69830.1 LacI family transcriptional regulator [Pseudoscardovia suis]
MTSLKDIAKKAGVSVCAVSLVLNGKDKNRVSEATAQLIRDTAASLHYEPNMMARTLKTNKSHTLGFVTDEIITTPNAVRIMLGAQEAARKLGYMLITMNTNNDKTLERQGIATLKRYHVDGFLYAFMYHRVVDVPDTLRKLPTVVVDAEDAKCDIPSIYPDEFAIGYDATTRLVRAGCKRIAYFGSEADIIAQTKRLAGYRQALQDGGMRENPDLIVGATEYDNADQRALKLLKEQQPDGVFSFNDVRAASLYMAANQLKLGIGTDISIVSVDNLPNITAVLRPGLTTIELPHYEMGFEAVRQLVAIIEQRNKPQIEPNQPFRSSFETRDILTTAHGSIIERDSAVAVSSPTPEEALKQD